MTLVLLFETRPAQDVPERVVPVTSTVTGVTSGFTYTVPKHGIVVLTMRTR